MNLVCLVNLQIPKKEAFYDPEDQTNCYYDLVFIKVDKEEEIKTHLLKFNTMESNDHIYFVMRSENDIVVKSKKMSFYRESPVESTHSIHKCIQKFKNDADAEESLQLVNPPDTYQYEEKVRVYNLKEEDKIKHRHISYLTAEDGDNLFIKELDQDHRNDGVFLDARGGVVTLRCIHQTDFFMRVKWCRELVHRMFYSVDFNKQTYQDFKVETK